MSKELNWRTKYMQLKEKVLANDAQSQLALILNDENEANNKASNTPPKIYNDKLKIMDEYHILDAVDDININEKVSYERIFINHLNSWCNLYADNQEIIEIEINNDFLLKNILDVKIMNAQKIDVSLNKDEGSGILIELIEGHPLFKSKYPQVALGVKGGWRFDNSFSCLKGQLYCLSATKSNCKKEFSIQITITFKQGKTNSKLKIVSNGASCLHIEGILFMYKYRG